MNLLFIERLQERVSPALISLYWRSLAFLADNGLNWLRLKSLPFFGNETGRFSKL